MSSIDKSRTPPPSSTRRHKSFRTGDSAGLENALRSSILPLSCGFALELAKSQYGRVGRSGMSTGDIRKSGANRVLPSAAKESQLLMSVRFQMLCPLLKSTSDCFRLARRLVTYSLPGVQYLTSVSWVIIWSRCDNSPLARSTKLDSPHQLPWDWC